MFIIYDTLRTRQKRNKLRSQVSELSALLFSFCFYISMAALWTSDHILIQLQLLSALSFFDILGSGAYALTTLPTPEIDHLYGAHGNKHTCTAQGFFIQIGTIACLLNVSLALYYLLTIKYGWTEERLKRTHATCVLVIPPIAVGLAFAYSDLLHSSNIWVWCNNAAKQVYLYLIDETIIIIFAYYDC